MTSHQENKTCTLVSLPKGENGVKVRWVYRLKTEGDKSRYKSRLIAKGYSQQLSFAYNKTYTVVANIFTIRVLLCIICKSYKIVHGSS